jgi:hypothetical protein
LHCANTKTMAINSDVNLAMVYRNKVKHRY